jgi:bifunctional DNase/RNase
MDWADVGAFSPVRRLELLGIRTMDEDGARTPVMLLRETGGVRILVIALENVDALAVSSAQEVPPNPTAVPYALLVDTLGTFGLRLEKAVIEAATNAAGGAVLTVSGTEVPARPSDAVMLTLATGAPLYATDHRLEVSGAEIVGPDETRPG